MKRALHVTLFHLGLLRDTLENLEVILSSESLDMASIHARKSPQTIGMRAMFFTRYKWSRRLCTPNEPPAFTGVAGFHLPMSPALPHNYALLYVEGESTFQNLTIPLTGRRNSAGIFAGMNSDNLFLELAQ